jgi:sensor histidine kinase YesM
MTIRLKDLNKIEFWIATFLYAFAILLLLSNVNGQVSWHTLHQFEEAKLKFHFLSNFFLPELLRYSILYFSFLLLNFCVVPGFLKKTDPFWNVILVVGLFLFTALATGVSYTYSRAWIFSRFDNEADAYGDLFFHAFTYAAWMILIICLYTGLKKLIIYFMENKDQHDAENYQMKLDLAFGGVFWFAGFLLWIAGSGPIEVIVCWTLIVFSAIGLTVHALYDLIPKIKSEGGNFKRLFWRICLLSLILWVPMGFVAILLSSHVELAFIMLLFHIPTQLILTAPLAWFIYKKRNENTAEIKALKSKLGKSDASLSFLKSQINPHFLFNALNTLYGTALQEKAERTGEGIQKLGDMMRFMLQENIQDKIALSRDIDYLNNYIALQKLRTSTSSQIVLETQIEDQPNVLQIAPMLLIPFVENAFKHGISLQHPSHIRITLQTKDNTLFFDVHNSIHLKADNDPEKLKSGIGLQNVKQRLALLYPDKHELLIRESAKEFFIHLTLHLH